MKAIIDRFEGRYAICKKEDNTMIDILKSKLPFNAKEGDVLSVEGDVISIDEEETQNRKKRIEELSKDLWI